VLRIGHRAGRDPRLSTHLALVARAFGAERMFLHPPDPSLATRLAAVVDRWGGTFQVVGADAWKPIVRDFDGTVVHLTMYGEPIEKVLPRLRRSRRLLLVVGGAKVPPELYQLATWNVAVGHEPHSEVAAVAVTLERLRGVPGPGANPGGRQQIVPRTRGKKVRTHRGRA
jgi:tRNA (cytidine56-2'-O)-methyltransferase